MTPDEYRAAVTASGLTPRKPSLQGGTLHATRNGDFYQVPDPEQLKPEERVAMIAVIKAWLGDAARELARPSKH
jgi:hypothetical protein